MPIGSSLAPYKPLVEGQEIGGTIVDFRIQQKTDYDSRRPLYLCDGGKGFAAFDGDGAANKPITDYVLTLEGEDGEEFRIFVDPRTGKRGSAVEGKRGLDAVIAAVKEAGASKVGLEIGGKFFITRGPMVAPARGEAKCVTYTARYEPPAGGPGSGQPVDETVYLVGGQAWDPRERELKPVVSSFDPPPAPERRIAGGPTGAAVGAGGGVMVRQPETDEPPF